MYPSLSWRELFQPHSPLWHYLWLAPHLMQFAIAAVMVKRRMVREFPMFFVYTIFQATKESSLFLLDHSPSISPLAYWSFAGIGMGGDVITRFAAIYEIFGKVFRPYAGLKRLGDLLLKWSGALLLMVAVAVAWYAPGVVMGRVTDGYNLVDRTISLVQSGLLVFLFVFASYFGITWRNFTFGIALGLGIYASVVLFTAAIRVQSGPFRGDFFLDFLLMVTYHVSVLLWLAYLLLPEAASAPISHLPENNLEQWNAELERLLLQ